jgi:hypothetical protein
MWPEESAKSVPDERLPGWRLEFSATLPEIGEEEIRPPVGDTKNTPVIGETEVDDRKIAQPVLSPDNDCPTFRFKKPRAVIAPCARRRAEDAAQRELSDETIARAHFVSAVEKTFLHARESAGM